LRSREVARSTGARIQCRIQCARKKYRCCALGSARALEHLPEASRRVSFCRAQAAPGASEPKCAFTLRRPPIGRGSAPNDCRVVRVRRWIGRGCVTYYATRRNVAVDWDGPIQRRQLPSPSLVDSTSASHAYGYPSPLCVVYIYIAPAPPIGYSGLLASLSFASLQRCIPRFEICTLVELSPAPSLPGPSDPTHAHHPDAPWSQRHPSAVRLEALTSPPRSGSQDYPTVPGYPVAAAVVFPTSHAATQRSKVATSIRRRRRDESTFCAPCGFSSQERQLFNPSIQKLALVR
jgi:hypothetical protein